MALGSNIKTARECHGWTLEQLSAICGVKTSTLGMLEQRDSKTNRDAPDIALALGVTLHLLLKGSASDVASAVNEHTQRAFTYQSTTASQSLQHRVEERITAYNWPFFTLTPQQWSDLSDSAKHAVEQVAIELLATLRKESPRRALPEPKSGKH